MLPIRSSTRLAISIGLISAFVIWMAVGLKLIPDATHPQIEGRLNFVDSVGLSASALLDAQREPALRRVLTELVRRNSQLLSVGLRDPQGVLTFEVGGHQSHWVPNLPSTDFDHMAIRLLKNGEGRGSLEFTFSPLRAEGWLGYLAFPVPLVLFCGAMMILLNWSYLGRTLRKLTPARLVPDRVRSAFDTLTDGLLLIDLDRQIVMANQAFLRLMNIRPEDVAGRNIANFDWRFEEQPGRSLAGSPWERCLRSVQTQRGDLVSLVGTGPHPVRYAVGATPIIGDGDECRGALVSFHDVTALELKKEQMGKMLMELSASRDEVQRKNRDLQVLASTDPLTGCLNRRSFFDRFRTTWEKSPAGIAAIMVDIDHFKLINDKFGHSTGDVVLQATGKLLLELISHRGFVGRYGGEEFAIIVDAMDRNSAHELANTIRTEFARRRLGGLDATLSIGFSSREQGAADCEQLLEQADQSLYVAKREGRNRIICWDANAPSQSFIDEQSMAIRRSGHGAGYEKSAVIQYPVVTAMLSALAFRHRESAAHSTRVARLCLQVGSRLLSKDELYELEIAALLHDVGKIGVPDSILKKPGVLTPDEWKVMCWHDEIGIEIVRSAFASEKITEFIRCHYKYRKDPACNSLDNLETAIPLGSRVLTVCDAFDAMTHHQVYRPARSTQEALEELYRESNGKFDPLVVRTLERVLADEERTRAAQPEMRSTLPPAPAPLEMGVFVEHLSNAIATGDVEQLREIAKRVELAAAQHNIESVVKAANRLEASIDQNEASLNHLVELADEIIDLCRSSRSRIIENPIVLRSEELNAGQFRRSKPENG